MKWDITPVDAGLVKDLASRFQLDLVTAAVLFRRGLLDPADIMFFAEDDLRYLHNPFLFSEMEDFVDRVHQAKAEHETVMVFGDRDVDGITAITIMVEALTALGVQVEWSLPMGDEPYGLTVAAVEAFAARGGTLIITVDCGISNVDEVARAAELGVDVIVLDHHQPPEVLPDAAAIINPQVADSGYPFRQLAGCGVAIKAAWALEFSRTRFYGQTMVLLNVRPGNDSYIIEAIKMRNLAEVDRVCEIVTPGMVSLQRTRLPAFFQHPIYVYDAPVQKEMLKKIFGPNTDIYLMDAATEFRKVFPVLTGKSLLSAREMSKSIRFKREKTGEIEAFSTLFVSWVFRLEPRLLKCYENNLDLAAMGTLADLMPMVNENRILVKQGLKLLSAGNRTGARELLRKLNLLGKQLTAKDIGWSVAPVINASGRMGEPDKAVRLFLEGESAEDKEGLAEEVVELNRRRRQTGDEVWTIIQPEAEKSLERLNGKLVAVFSDTMNRGITGLVAARLTGVYKVPCVVCARMEDKIVGSVRSARGYDVQGLLSVCADLFTTSGGHTYAGGFNLESSLQPQFEERLLHLSRSIEFDEEAEPEQPVDANIPAEHLLPDLEKVLDFFAPHGEGNPPLLFLTRRIKIVDMELIGKKDSSHLKLTLAAGPAGKPVLWPALMWQSAHRANVDFAKNEVVDILYQMQKNYFQNRESLQLVITDIKRSE